MKIGFFDTKEFYSRDDRPSPYPTVVRSELIELLNHIRKEFKQPILVTSGYRSPERNAAVGGVKNSTHIQGIAADIRPKDLADLPELQSICLRFNPEGGVGLYDTFVHVDVRGQCARWDERKRKSK